MGRVLGCLNAILARGVAEGGTGRALRGAVQRQAGARPDSVREAGAFGAIGAKGGVQHATVSTMAPQLLGLGRRAIAGFLRSQDRAQ